jgi:hypothetical protein
MELLHADKFGHWFLFQNNHTLYLSCDFWTEYADGQVFFILSPKESESYFADGLLFLHKLVDDAQQNPGSIDSPYSYTRRTQRDFDTYGLGSLTSRGSQLAKEWCIANNTEEAERIYIAQRNAQRAIEDEKTRAQDEMERAERERKEKEAIESRRAWERMPSGDVEDNT